MRDKARLIASKNSSLVAALAALLAAGCSVFRAPSPPAPPVVATAPVEPEPPRIEAIPADTAAASVAQGNDEPAVPWPERTLAQMTLRRKVGQMMMPPVLGDFSPEGSTSETRVERLIDEQQIGGLLVSVGMPTEVAVKLNELQARSQVPLLVGSDLETGAGFRLRGAVDVKTGIDLGGATEFPSQMAVGATGDPRLAYEMGRITAEEGRAVGIQVPFAPVLDVNNNPDNPIINVRSFGEDPELVARLGAAYVRGVDEHGAMATGKHFPGHGDTDVNSHTALPVNRAPRPRLDSVELVPFRAAIDAGLGAIMTAHIGVPALENGSSDPATLSPQVMTGLLRGQLGFGGLVFTDALDMGAIDRGYGRTEAPVRAVLAGADVILQPPSVATAIDAIVAAVEGGRIPESRIDESVLRILRVKEKLGLAQGGGVPPGDVHRKVGIPEHVAVAQEIANKSLVLLKNGRDLLPLAGTRGAQVISVTFRRSPNDLLAGRYFNEQLRATYAGLLVESTDRTTPRAVWQTLDRATRKAKLVVVSVYVTAWDEGAIPKEVTEFIQGLARRRVPHVVISFGNPYLLRRFPDAQAYLLAWSGAEVSQRAAARALVGDIPITGRSPTRVGDFEIGAGIQLRPRAEP